MESQQKRVTKINSSYVKEHHAYKERQLKKKKRLFRRLTFFAIILIAVFWSLTSYHMKQRALYEEKKEIYENLQAEMDKLQSEEKKLTEEIELLKDTDYVLQIARKDYFLSKEGEIIFKVPDEETSY
ncbi:FtsB family cell division protein [Salirhabdus salicampi]|uniref:FtsB family cell division protein n=1 Tax=Salirhabdus salicampi TaxID=476102 RepID=UPI0020C21CCA|nr:septum formation initiator family protein [Salirhabdus salicampi]MCP8618183.1 septum formation initiator family protein [Salirhabdus salicampi]